MESPYLTRLRTEMGAAADPVRTALIQADVAAYWARAGQFAEASALIDSLRAQFKDGRSGPVTAKLMLADGLLIYFRDLKPEARLRIAGAQALSVAGRDAELTALTSAWLAHIDFNLHRHADMARALSTCFSVIQPSDSMAVCRVALTLGDAFMACLDPVTARRWYALAHEYVVRLGDHTFRAAWVYNKAALGVFTARLRSLQFDLDPIEVSLLLGETRTAMNYQSVAEQQAFQAAIDNTFVSALILSGDFEQARSRGKILLESLEPFGVVKPTVLLRSDLALCAALTGRGDEAHDLLCGLHAETFEGATSDDRLLAYSSLARAAGRIGDTGRESEFLQRAAQARSEFELIRDEMIRQLAPFKTSSLLEQLGE